MLAFTASPLSASINLDWSTATEKQNSGFEVQRTQGVDDFKTIGWIEGNGTTISQHDYIFRDYDVKPNVVYYYRLHQIDYNGESAYSPVVSSQLKGRFINASVFPNPVTNESVLSYFIDRDAKVSVSAINTIGEEIMLQKDIDQSAGPQHLFINPSSMHLASGLYTLKINVNGQDEFLKLIVSSN